MKQETCVKLLSFKCDRFLSPYLTYLQFKNFSHERDVLVENINPLRTESAVSSVIIITSTIWASRNAKVNWKGEDSWIVMTFAGYLTGV